MNSFAELDLTSRVDFTGGALPSGFTAARPPLTAFHMEFDNAGHLIGAVLGTRLTHASSDWSIGPDDGGDALFSIGRRLDVDVKFTRYVKSVFIVHVGGTRCVTSRTDNIMKIRARITLTVEFI
jgi:hypothetical protein